jgi:ComF family protein
MNTTSAESHPPTGAGGHRRFYRAANAVRRILAVLFPKACPLCGKNTGTDAVYGICAPCLRGARAAFPKQEECCRICGQILVSERGICMNCRRRETAAFDRVLALYPYGGVYRSLLKAYKFGRYRETGGFFVECLVRALSWMECQTGVVVPTPPREGKIKSTMWDQIEYLAALLEKKRGENPRIPAVYRCLKRFSSKTQKVLNRTERATNLIGKITVKAGFTAPETAILIDDVYTTGATMNACAQALKQAGTKTVIGISLFYG